jgi:hypothetical protein
MPTQTNQIEAKLKLTADSTDISGKAGELEKKLERLEKLEKSLLDYSKKLQKANEDLAKSVGGIFDEKSGKNAEKAVNGTASNFSKIGDAAIASKLKVAALAAAITATIEVGANARSFVTDPTKSPATATQAFLESIPLFGEISKSLRRSVTKIGFSESSHEWNFQKRANETAIPEAGINAAQNAFTFNTRMEIASARARAHPPATFHIDRGELESKYERRFADLFEDPEARKAAARRDLVRANNVLAAAAREKIDDNKYNTLDLDQKRLEEIKKERTGYRGNNPFQVMQLEAENERLTVQVTEKLKQRQLVEDKYKESMINATNAQKAVADADTEIARAQKNKSRILLEEARGGAIGFGAMSDVDQLMLRAAAEQMQRGGMRSLSHEQKGMVLSSPITASMAQDMMAKEYKDDPNLGKVLRIAGKDGLDAAQKKFEEASNKVQVEVVMNEQKFFKAMADALEASGLTAISIAMKMASIAREQVQQAAQTKRIEEATK